MSAYSEWKCGAITDEEYGYYANRAMRKQIWQEKKEEELINLIREVDDALANLGCEVLESKTDNDSIVLRIKRIDE